MGGKGDLATVRKHLIEQSLKERKSRAVTEKSPQQNYVELFTFTRPAGFELNMP
jgi:hypothetical protein